MDRTGSPIRTNRAIAEDDDDSRRSRKRRRQISTEELDPKPGPSGMTRSRHRSPDERHSGEERGQSKTEAAIKSEEVEKCAICLSPNIEAPTSLNACQHIYCLVCIRSWISQQGTCPLCKTQTETITYRKKDSRGQIHIITESVKDLMKAHRDAKSAGNGLDVMASEAAALNVVIRRIRAEIEMYNRSEETCISSKNIEERKRLCILLTGYRRLAADMGNKPREDIVDDVMFRRLFYDRLFVVNLVPPSNNAVNVSPERFRTDAALIERAEAFLCRDLQILCSCASDVQNAKKVIMTNLGILAIENRELISVIRSATNIHCSRHLIRSLADFLRSGLSLGEYNSRSHHMTSAEAANQLNEHYRNSDSGDDDDPVIERVINISNNRFLNFPPSISEAIDGMPLWQSGTIYRDRFPDQRPITLNSDAEDDNSDDEAGIYTRNCLLRRPRYMGVPTPSLPMSSEEAMNLFGGATSLPSTSAFTSIYRRVERPDARMDLSGPGMMSIMTPLINNPEFMRLLRAARGMVDRGTQTIESGRTGRRRVPGEVIHLSDDEEDREEVVIHEEDDDIHVIESPKEEDSRSSERGRNMS
uniref:RING-type E3 ubiquitin transferase n=1 Tax=Steinernema glaseri TaxID=37863 RepID=A0A1I7ZGE0_9BILA